MLMFSLVVKMFILFGNVKIYLQYFKLLTSRILEKNNLFLLVEHIKLPFSVCFRVYVHDLREFHFSGINKNMDF